MRRLFLVALASLVLQISAWADGIDLVNDFGSISISSAGIMSRGSELRQYNGIVAGPGHALGSVSFSIGSLSSGSIFSGGVFSDIGSTFQVVSRGNGGQPKGVIFSGAFVGPITWTLVSQSGQGLIFQLTGTISGRLFNGHMVTGTTMQMFHTTQAQLGEGIVDMLSGDTHLVATPEPGTMGLFGLGLLVISTVGRRSLAKRHP